MRQNRQGGEVSILPHPLSFKILEILTNNKGQDNYGVAFSINPRKLLVAIR